MFTNLLIVVAAGLLAPLALGFFPRVRLPAIVLEIVLGIVIGPSGLGWVKPDAPVSILALVGLAFLLFLASVHRCRDPDRPSARRRLRASAAGLVAAGLLSVVISPALGLVLLRREGPETATPRARPTPIMPVLTAEDRALSRASEVKPAA